VSKEDGIGIRKIYGTRKCTITDDQTDAHLTIDTTVDALLQEFDYLFAQEHVPVLKQYVYYIGDFLIITIFK
jgi:hypothetical protein